MGNLGQYLAIALVSNAVWPHLIHVLIVYVAGLVSGVALIIHLSHWYTAYRHRREAADIKALPAPSDDTDSKDSD